MATRNFVFRKSPLPAQRGGRFVYDGATPITSGVPVVVNASGDDDGLGRLKVELATGAQDKPKAGLGGIAVFENIDFIGSPQGMVTFSDVDQIVKGDAIQVVTGNGGTVKVAFTNILPGGSYINRDNYPKGRIMVAGVSQATPLVSVGDYLTPGVGTDEDGYWTTTIDADEAWLIVTRVDASVGLVEAELNI